jgi:N-acetylglucosaminyldiphosphoundecaprenol N-acetyl-beta-D-mannosaminyltransferase
MSDARHGKEGSRRRDLGGGVGRQAESVSVLGVRIANCSRLDAIALIEGLITERQRAARALFIVNAHTLNLAARDADYLEILNSALVVFGDGTGIRWASRLRGVFMQDNLVGTDLIPALFEATAGRGYRYFLLGADAASIARAANACKAAHPGWELAGYHHGYVDDANLHQILHAINSAHADLLLVGMGNPRQERWIHDHLQDLDVRVCIGVGGLFDHWAGNLRRAPPWIRRQGFEWLHILLQQPHKWRRYIVGNPLFVVRMLAALAGDRAACSRLS